MIQYTALAVFIGALVIYAYLLIDPFRFEEEIPPSLTLIVGFGVAFIRDYLTESRMAARLDRAEQYARTREIEIIKSHQAEQPVATREERQGNGK